MNTKEILGLSFTFIAILGSLFSWVLAKLLKAKESDVTNREEIKSMKKDIERMDKDLHELRDYVLNPNK